MGKIRITRTQLHGPFPTGAWDRLMPGDLAEKFDMAKLPLQRVETTRCNLPLMVSDFSA
jgi:hypothetical protein